MSQISRSQSNYTSLKELVENCSDQFNQSEIFNYDINEDYFDSINDLNDENNSIYKENNQFIDNLNKFCLNNLNKYSFEQLFDSKIFSLSHSILYSNFKCLINNLKLSFEQTDEFKLASLLSSLELIFEYFTKSSSITQIKFEQIDLFILSILNSFVHLCDYIKCNKQIINFTQKTSSQQTGTRIDLKLSSILIKISSLFESKIANLNEINNKENLVKVCKFLIYLVKNFKDTKSNVFVWKAMSKLTIKFKILLYDYENDYNEFYAKNCKFLLKKIFITLYEDQCLDLNYIKDTLNRISLNESNSNNIHETSNMLSSQMTLKNDIYQNTVKVIKLSAFLSKIFKSFLSLYFNELFEMLNTDFFYKLTDFLSLINYIILIEGRVKSDCLLIDSNENEFKPNQLLNISKDYQTIKLDFLKEFSQIYESIFQLIETNKDYTNYLLKQNDFLTKLNEKSEQNDITESQSDNMNQTKLINSIEELVIFYSIWINKNKYWSNLKDEYDIKQNFNFKLEPFYLNNILNLLELCQTPLNTPTYFLYCEEFFQKYDFNCLISSNYESNRTHFRIEFYDFVLLNLSKYIQILLSQNSENLIYFLCNNLLVINNFIDENSNNQIMFYETYPMRVQVSNDLIIYLTSCLLKSKKSANFDALIKLIKFLSDLYENTGCSIISCKNVHLKNLLLDIFENCSSIFSQKFSLLITQLSDYYVNKNYSNCFNIISPYVNKIHLKEVFLCKTLMKLNDLYEQLIKLFNEKNKAQNEQIWIKKLLVFIDSKHIVEFLNILNDFFNLNQNINMSEFNINDLISEQAEILIKNTIVFLKLNEIDNLIKYFDQFNNYKTEMNRKIDNKMLISKQFSSNLDNFKRIFQFICDTINLFTVISVQADLGSKIESNTNLTFMLNFLIKHCSLNYETKIGQFNSDYESSFLNLKIQACIFLRQLAKREIADPNLNNKIIELFSALLTDSNYMLKCFALECLDESSNQIICKLKKSNQNISSIILSYLGEIDIEPEFNEIEFYQEKTMGLIKKLRMQYEAKDLEEKCLSQKYNEDENGGLDETMNAIMCAMDTTISNSKFNNEPEIEDESTKSKAKILIENMINDLNKLLELYENNSYPDWVKEKLTNLSQKISECF